MQHQLIYATSGPACRLHTQQQWRGVRFECELCRDGVSYAAGWRTPSSMISSGCYWSRRCSSKQHCMPAAHRWVGLSGRTRYNLMAGHEQVRCPVTSLSTSCVNGAGCRCSVYCWNEHCLVMPRAPAEAWSQAVSAAALRWCGWAGADEGGPHEGSSGSTAGQGSSQSSRSTGASQRVLCSVCLPLRATVMLDCWSGM